MARSKSFFSLRRGRVGNMVYSRGMNGEQITREAPTQVANPQTRGQQAQRCAFTGVARYRSMFKDIVDHSFEGEPIKQGSLSAFQRVNLRKSQVMDYVASEGTRPDNYFLALGTKTVYDDARASLTFAPVVMSQGSLLATSPKSIFSGASTSPATAILWHDEPIQFKPTAESIVEVTMQDYVNRYDIQKGDMLTFVLGSGWRPDLGCCWVRIRRKDVDIDEADLAIEQNIAKYFEVEVGGNWIRNYVAGVSFYTDTTNPDPDYTYRGLGIRLVATAEAQSWLRCAGFTVIRSRKSENVWRRSPQVLQNINPDAVWLETDCYRDTIEEWAIGESYILNGSQEYFSTIGGGGTGPRPVPPRPEQEPFIETAHWGIGSQYEDLDFVDRVATIGWNDSGEAHIYVDGGNLTVNNCKLITTFQDVETEVSPSSTTSSGAVFTFHDGFGAIERIAIKLNAQTWGTIIVMRY